MKRFFAVLMILLPLVTFAQLKQQAEPVDIGQAIIKPGAGLLMGILNPEKFHMSHSFSTSFMSGGAGSAMVNSYMNTIQYQISAPLMLRLNVGLMSSPYNSFNKKLPALNSTQFFGSAELQYRPSKNTLLHLGISTFPTGSYYYSPYRY